MYCDSEQLVYFIILLWSFPKFTTSKKETARLDCISMKQFVGSLASINVYIITTIAISHQPDLYQSRWSKVFIPTRNI